MWDGIASALERGAVTDLADEAVTAPADDDEPFGAGAGPLAGVSAYHEPPEPPRDAMWERIEAAWALRRSVPPAVRTAGLDDLDEPEVAHRPERPELRAAGLWIGALAVAASLVIGIALGRGSVRFDDGGTRLATRPETGAPATTGPASDPADGTPGGESDLVTAPAPAAEPELLESSGRLAAGPGAARTDVSPDPETGRDDPSSAGSRDDRRAVAARYATAATLDRVETLLTVFRTDDRAGGGQDELADWARELLGETRLLLDMGVERSPAERRLLEELELVLAQIARLGPEAPEFERDLITEGIERQGTITRLRSAAVTVGT